MWSGRSGPGEGKRPFQSRPFTTFSLGTLAQVRHLSGFCGTVRHRDKVGFSGHFLRPQAMLHAVTGCLVLLCLATARLRIISVTSVPPTPFLYLVALVSKIVRWVRLDHSFLTVCGGRGGYLFPLPGGDLVAGRLGRARARSVDPWGCARIRSFPSSGCG